MTQKTNPWTFDVRVRERNLKSGSITEKDVDKYVAGLPDLADQAEPFGTAQPALAQPPAPPAPPSVDDIDDEDDEDDDLEVAETAAAAAPEVEPQVAQPAPAPVPASEPADLGGAPEADDQAEGGSNDDGSAV